MAAANGAIITLTGDLTAGGGDTCLTIPAGKSITIDLQGHTLERGLAGASSAADGGSVFKVDYQRTLTLTSNAGTGTITGGYNDYGGAFYVDGGGTLNLENVTVSGNRSVYGASAIHSLGTVNIMAGTVLCGNTTELGYAAVETTGTVNMAGGSITGNNKIGVFVNHGTTLSMTGGSITGNDAGVYVTGAIQGQGTLLRTGNIRICGSVTISGNSGSNVTLGHYSEGDAILGITGPLSSNARIGITVQDGHGTVLTNGLNTNGHETAEFFTSDNPEYVIVYDNSIGEACLVSGNTIRFLAGYETEETMEPVTVEPNGTYTLPACGFTAPEGQTFKEWSVAIGSAEPVTKNPGETITVTADTTATAVWEAVPAPVFRGHAILVSGQIGLQFFLELPTGKTPADNPDSYVTFAGNKINSATQHPLPGSTAIINGTDSGRYLFTINLSSIQMAEKITPTFHWTEMSGDKTVAGAAYSVEDYINWAIGAESTLSDWHKGVARALADYGYYAQPYLSAQNGWTIGTDYAAMTTHVTDSYDYDTVKTAAETYAIVKGTNESITKVSYKMQFASTITLRITLTPASGVTLSTVLLDGQEITPVKSGRNYVVDIPNIKATELTDTHTIVAASAETTVSPMSYVYDMIRSTTNEAGKNLVCALFNYAQACAE